MPNERLSAKFFYECGGNSILHVKARLAAQTIWHAVIERKPTRQANFFEVY